MRNNSRAHEVGSVEAGTSISKSIFSANRVVGAVVGAFAGASQGAQERTGQPNRASQGAQERAGQPNRISQGAQGRIEADCTEFTRQINAKNKQRQPVTQAEIAH